MSGSKWLLMATVAGIAIGFTSVASAGTTDQDFANPPKSARPWVRWWWPGGDVSDAELKREIDVLDKGGFGGGEIQPFKLALPKMSADDAAKVDDYATAPFFANVKAAAAEALVKGLQIDYTFGSAWPQGGGYAITPEKSLVELTMASTTVEGGKPGPVKITLPKRTRKIMTPMGDPRMKDPKVSDWPARINAEARLVAVIAIKGSAPQLSTKKPAGIKILPWKDVDQPGALDANTAVDITDKVDPDGTVHWDVPAGEWQIVAFKQYVADSGAGIAAGQGPQFVLDHFDKSAFDAHAARVADPLVPALGADKAALRATFIDSFELMPDIYWSRDFLDAFKIRHGYDLKTYLPFILQPGWNESWSPHYSPPYYDAAGVGDRVREDYEDTVSDLMIERFAKPWVEWNHAHGILARLQAHGGPWDVLKAYGMADIPETEDLADDGDPNFMRVARSAADLYGRKIVGAESLCWPKRPYDVSPDEYRRRADLIFASGVNAMVFHGYAYALGDQWPGWYPFGPSNFNPGFSSMWSDRNPLWPAVNGLTGYVARTQAVLRHGTNVVPVAVFLQGVGYYKGIETRDGETLPIDKQLLVAGYDYDRINADAILSAHTENGQLVTVGGARFAAVIFPSADGLSSDVAKRLPEFAKAGVKIVFADHLPTRARGFSDHEARDKLVVDAAAAAGAAGAQVVPSKDLVASLKKSGVPANLTFEHPTDKLVFIEKMDGQRRVFFIHNNSNEPVDASFATAAQGAVTRWSALDGSKTNLAATVQGGETHVPLRFQGGDSALLVFDTDQKAAAPTRWTSTASQAIAATGWTIRAVGHGKGGRIIEGNLPTGAEGDLKAVAGFEDFSGTVFYSHRLAVPKGWVGSGKKVLIDLGEVHDAAIVSVDGKEVETLLGAPWQADVTRYLKPGVNMISIAVVNRFANAMYDKDQPGFKDVPVQPGGLYGPVSLQLLTK